MSGVKHTPGPWEAYEQEARSNRWSVMGDDVVADLWRLGEEDHVPYPHEEGRAQANASLIAAAPDLLDAVQVLVTECSQIWSEAELPALKQARAAIARARGEQDGGGE